MELFHARTPPETNRYKGNWIVLMEGRKNVQFPKFLVDSNFYDLDAMEYVASKVFDEMFKVFFSNVSGVASIQIVGRTNIRKRVATIYKAVISFFDHWVEQRTPFLYKNENENFLTYYECTILLSDAVYESIYENVPVIASSYDSYEYSGNDVLFLEDPDQRYPWQKTFLTFFYEPEKKTIKKADGRSLYWIYDPRGVTGKSKLIKWIAMNHPDDIIKLAFGSSNQLRTGIVRAGPRRCYFLDLPRTKNRQDEIEPILSTCEDLLNGFVSSFMYGRYSQLLMEPPHVFVFSNEKCPRQLLSEDRWKSFEITKNKRLKETK